MGSQAFSLRAADATEWRWARDNEGRALARVTTVGLFIGLLAVEVASLVPAISPSHVEIWRVALGAPIILAIALLLPRCFGKPVTTRFVWGIVAIASAVVVTLIHIAPPTTAMLLTLIAVVITVAHFMSARDTLIITGVMTLAACSLPIISPPGPEHIYTAAQLAVYVPVLWALAAIFYFQGRGLRESVAQAITASSEDAVTAASNLRTAEEDFTARFAAVERRGSGNVGIILINVANLPEIEHSRGHDVVDQVIAEVAAQLRRVARPDWTFARINAEDMLVQVSGITEQALTELSMLCRGAAASASVELGIPLTVHAGTALAPLHGKRLDTLLDFAQARVYNDMRDFSRGFDSTAVGPSNPVRAIRPGTAKQDAVNAAGWRTRLPKLPRRVALLIDFAVFALLGIVIAETGGSNSPAMMLVFVYVAIQAWMWHEKLIGWRLFAPAFLLASPLLYESAIHRLHPEARASLQLNSIVIAVVATVVAISVYRSRSHAHAVARHAAEVDPETQLLTRQAFEHGVEHELASRGKGVTVVEFELRGADRFARSAGRSELTQMMIAIAERLASTASKDELIGRIGTHAFALATPHGARETNDWIGLLRGELKQIVDGFMVGHVKVPRIEVSLTELESSAFETPHGHAVRGEGLQLAQVAS